MVRATVIYIVYLARVSRLSPIRAYTRNVAFGYVIFGGIVVKYTMYASSGGGLWLGGDCVPFLQRQLCGRSRCLISKR